MVINLLCGDVIEQLRTLPDRSINTCVTSPPYYGLRDYGVGKQQIGLEETPEEYINKLVEVFREVRRVLRDDGILWVNIGDSYNGSGKGRKADGSVASLANSPISSKVQGQIQGNFTKTKVTTCKSKDLIGIPWMLAFALRADGWYLRQDIIWAKANPMPESVKDRCTRSHEYVFMLTKSKRYYFDHEAIQEPAATAPTGKRNKRDVWQVGVCSTVKEAHFAVFPKELIEPCVLSSCPEYGVVLDPFSGSGTTGIVAITNNRNYIGIDLNSEYHNIARRRFEKECTNVSIVEVDQLHGTGTSASKTTEDNTNE